MTRVIRIVGKLLLICTTAVVLAVYLGRALPPEEEIIYAANLDNGDSEIYRMALNRQLAVPLTHNDTEDSQPAWSPDGRQIAFVSNPQGQYTIYLMDEIGHNIRRLTDSPQNNFSPAWSPDERSIAYVTARQEFARQITELLLTDLQSGLTRRITIPYPNAISPAWAPDSRHIAFTSRANDSANRIIYNLDVQTGDTDALIKAHDVQLNPTWSPDGRYLLYIAYDTNPGMYLWDAANAESLLLFAPDVLNMRNISWSPDSRYIIYAPLTTSGLNSILRLDVAACRSNRQACQPQPITHVTGNYDSPRWRPHTS